MYLGEKNTAILSTLANVAVTAHNAQPQLAYKKLGGMQATGVAGGYIQLYLSLIGY
jgi:hypothetical protein